MARRQFCMKRRDFIELLHMQGEGPIIFKHACKLNLGDDPPSKGHLFE